MLNSVSRSEPLRLHDFAVCPICGTERHRVPWHEWQNQEPHQMKPEGNEIVLSCDRNHRWIVSWEES